MVPSSLYCRNQKGPAVNVETMKLSADIHARTWPFEVMVEPVTANHALVRVRGDADMITAPRLLAAINDAVAAFSDITLDLSGVNFFSCSAAEIVLNAYAKRPDHLRVLAPSRAARRVLALFGDDDLVCDITSSTVAS